MSRLSLSDSDNYVRDWFVDTMRSLNCSTTIDAMGNDLLPMSTNTVATDADAMPQETSSPSALV